MADKRKLIVEIIGDPSSLEKAFGKSEKAGGRFGRTMGKVGKAAAFTAGGVAIGGLVVGLKRGVDEFNQSQEVAAQTAAVLRSTGKAAGVTGKHVGDLATKLSIMSGVDDEVIQGQENMLLAFTRVRNEAGKGNKIFDRATKLILDYSVRTGKDGRGAAVLFGKALNEIAQGQIPKSIRGLGKLSEATQKQIKAHLDAGDAAGAQAVLLDQLEKRYGGAAKAGGDTFAGSLNKVSNAFDEVAGSIVAGAAPALQKYADRLSKWLSKAENQKKIQDAVNQIMRVAGQVIKDVTGFIKTMIPIVERIVGLFGGWKHVIELLIALKLLRWMSGVTGGFGGMATKGRLAASATKLLLGNLKNLAALGPIAIPLVIFLNRKAIDDWVTGFLNKHGFGFLTGDQINTFSDWQNAPDWAKKAARAKGFDPSTLPGAPKPAGSRNTGGRGTAAAVVINGDIHLPNVSNTSEFIREMQKRAARTSASRAGRFGAVNMGLS